MTDETIAPCPFCGAAIGRNQVYLGDRFGLAVFCEGCKAQGPRRADDAFDDAKIAWNERTALRPAAPAAMLGELAIGDVVRVLLNAEKPWTADWQKPEPELMVVGLRKLHGDDRIEITLMIGDGEDWTDGFFAEDLALVRRAGHLVPAQAAEQVVRKAYILPEGWKAVPVEPTEAMLAEGEDAHDGQRYAGRLARPVWDAMLAASPAPSAEALPGMEEACKPWEFSTGPVPEWDSPLHGVFASGILHAEKLLCNLLGVKTYEPGDGSEDFDNDATTSLRNILTEARIWDKDEATFATLATGQAHPQPIKGQADHSTVRKILELVEECEDGVRIWPDSYEIAEAVRDRFPGPLKQGAAQPDPAGSARDEVLRQVDAILDAEREGNLLAMANASSARGREIFESRAIMAERLQTKVRDLKLAPPSAGAGNGLPKIIEAANTLDMGWALTCEWPDGSETIEKVSDQAAALLGYAPEDEDPAPPTAQGEQAEGENDV